MANRKASKQILGVMVTSRAVHAALLESDAGGVKVLQRFMRQRTARHAGVSQPSVPDLHKPEEEDDFSVQFTDTSAMAEHMFLGSEFGSAEGGGGFDPEGDKKEIASTFVLELGDILAECRDAGYIDPIVSFCAGSSEVNQVELRIVRETKSKSNGEAAAAKAKKSSSKVASRDELLDQLKQHHTGDFAEESVAFLPMTTSDEGAQRFLAIFPKALDPVAATLRTMREQQGRRMPTVRLLDTEVPLYLGLARATDNLSPRKRRDEEDQEDAETHTTLIVRAGAEDTLVLFMQGDTLRQSENLRSLTAYEAPETICSRVLLLQDEYGIGDVEHVLLLSEEREDDLIESFEMFFPDARVETLRRYVPAFQEEGRSDVPPGALVPAIGAALRLSDDDRYKQVFEEINMLPRQLLRRQISIPVTWHVLAIYVLLFCSVLFFMARYFTMENQISIHQRSIQDFQNASGPIPMEPKALQANIDSLQAVHTRYMRAINVLEGLLQGSDKWSRALEKTSVEVAKVTGIWIESWNPRSNGLELSGNATARDRVVELAQHLGATISTLTFSEIRDWPVYSFKLSLPLDNSIPEAAQFLRDRVTQAEEQAAAEMPVTPTSLTKKP